MSTQQSTQQSPQQSTHTFYGVVLRLQFNGRKVNLRNLRQLPPEAIRVLSRAFGILERQLPPPDLIDDGGFWWQDLAIAQRVFRLLAQVVPVHLLRVDVHHENACRYETICVPILREEFHFDNLDVLAM